MNSSVGESVAELSASQWGLFTSQQAQKLGVSKMDLSRMEASGELERVSHGIYRVEAVPSDRLDAIRAAWMSTDPGRLIGERIKDGAAGVVVIGSSAAAVHQLGQLRVLDVELASPQRRQTRREGIRLLRRTFSDRDVDLVEGLPVTTVEATIAELVAQRMDLTLVSAVFVSAIDSVGVDRTYLAELLAPLARRNGLPEGDGQGLVKMLEQLAGDLPARALAKAAMNPELSAAVAQMVSTEDMLRRVADALGYRDWGKAMPTLQVVEKVAQQLTTLQQGLSIGVDTTKMAQTLAELNGVDMNYLGKKVIESFKNG